MFIPPTPTPMALTSEMYELSGMVRGGASARFGFGDQDEKGDGDDDDARVEKSYLFCVKVDKAGEVDLLPPPPPSPAPTPALPLIPNSSIVHSPPPCTPLLPPAPKTVPPATLPGVRGNVKYDSITTPLSLKTKRFHYQARANNKISEGRPRGYRN